MLKARPSRHDGMRVNICQSNACPDMRCAGIGAITGTSVIRLPLVARAPQ